MLESSSLEVKFSDLARIVINSGSEKMEPSLLNNHDRHPFMKYTHNGTVMYISKYLHHIRITGFNVRKLLGQVYPIDGVDYVVGSIPQQVFVDYELCVVDRKISIGKHHTKYRADISIWITPVINDGLEFTGDILYGHNRREGLFVGFADKQSALWWPTLIPVNQSTPNIPTQTNSDTVSVSEALSKFPIPSIIDQLIDRAIRLTNPDHNVTVLITTDENVHSFDNLLDGIKYIYARYAGRSETMESIHYSNLTSGVTLLLINLTTYPSLQEYGCIDTNRKE